MLRTIVVVVLLVVCATAKAPNYNTFAQPSSTINYGQAFEMYWKALQKIMPCGYAPSDLPVLAPFKADFQAFNYTKTDYSFVGNISDYMLTGLSDFTVLSGSYDETTGTIAYDVIFKELQILSNYAIDSMVSIGGYPWRTQQRGLLNEKINDLRLVGHYTLGPSPYNASGLRLSNFSMNFYIADFELNNWNDLWSISLNNFANNWSREFIMMFAQQIQSQVNEIYAQLLLPQVNGYLGSINMSQLIDFLVYEAQLYNMANCTLKATN